MTTLSCDALEQGWRFVRCRNCGRLIKVLLGYGSWQVSVTFWRFRCPRCKAKLDVTAIEEYAGD